MLDRRERQLTGGFSLRLRDVVAAYGSAHAVAKAIERSEGAVRKWLRGESEPNVTDLRALCEQTHTSLEWLVTGRGRRETLQTSLSETPAPNPQAGASHPLLSASLLEDIMEALESELRQANLPFPPAKRALLVATLYGLFQESRKVDSEAVARLVRLAR
jgi:transcriptional regulator with XRE-family HTH domain